MSGAEVTAAARIAELIAAGRWLSQRGLLPATPGNLSCRLTSTDVAAAGVQRRRGALEIRGGGRPGCYSARR